MTRDLLYPTDMPNAVRKRTHRHRNWPVAWNCVHDRRSDWQEKKVIHRLSRNFRATVAARQIQTDPLPGGALTLIIGHRITSNMQICVSTCQISQFRIFRGVGRASGGRCLVLGQYGPYFRRDYGRFLECDAS